MFDSINHSVLDYKILLLFVFALGHHPDFCVASMLTTAALVLSTAVPGIRKR
jgi:hypothetical protein